MLARRQQPKALRSLIALLSLSLLASCSNSEAIENFINADPQLQTEAKPENSPQNSTANNSQTNQDITPESPNSEVDPQPEVLEPVTSEQSATNLTPDYLSDLPEEIPFYPQAQLQPIEAGLTAESGSLKLRSQDNLGAIADFYKEQLQTQAWEIIQPFVLESDGNSQSTIASKNNLKVKISLAELPADNEENSSQTEINIAYEPFIANLTTINPESDLDSEETSTVSETPPNEPEVTTDNIPVTTAVTEFTDLGEAREQLQQAVQEVAALGILTPQTKDTPNKFAPNELVTRRDYARWLVSANNKFHDNYPGKKIHRAGKTDQIAFKDIDVNDPDFGEIQGLAEAGLIPSILTSDSNNVLFRPDATLTREDLISWKVPLDLRGALSKASIETIETTWGFQDAAKIDSLAIKALFSDYQNGDHANVSRIFGYTTLFQPKKGVTRAEAAASLWYFGYQGDGLSAEELLDTSIN